MHPGFPNVIPCCQFAIKYVNVDITFHVIERFQIIFTTLIFSVYSGDEDPTNIFVLSKEKVIYVQIKSKEEQIYFKTAYFKLCFHNYVTCLVTERVISTICSLGIAEYFK